MKVILSFILIITFIACNNPKDPCANLICKDNQECVNGTCQCVPNSYNMGKWCFPKYNEFNWAFYSTSDTCSLCMSSDTAVVYLSKQLGNSPNNNGSFTLASMKDEEFWNTGIGGEISYYYKRTDGDSFRIFGVNNLNNCNEGGKKRNFPVLFGRLNPAKDTLKLKIVWHDPNSGTGLLVPIDSCTKLFTR
jgi:hypothetical protein